MSDRIGFTLLVLTAILWTTVAPLRAGDPSKAATNSLIADLRSVEDPLVRVQTVRNLRDPEHKGPQAFKALSWAMLNDLSNKVRQAAAVALIDYEGFETLNLLDKFFKGEIGDDVRLLVCVTLATAPTFMSNSGATTLLTERLFEDASPTVRMVIAQKLPLRQDKLALASLKRASKEDQDERVRAAASESYDKLSKMPTKLMVTPAKKREPAPYDAVKGVDRCPVQYGWCECSRPPLKIRPRCVERADCEYTFITGYKRNGFACSWNGENIE